ncbi:hypothetical protein [Halioxenophilus sp. WMMB6]|uniref:hypothetical protein n=1 Tax=Halioxenophilus sp. WMMB6 TaxID=3073815 RepID=UPI00295EE443|nr:hypothetical protein [Halioxenophilus sp. WMMB6]
MIFKIGSKRKVLIRLDAKKRFDSGCIWKKGTFVAAICHRIQEIHVAAFVDADYKNYRAAAALLVFIWLSAVAIC